MNVFLLFSLFRWQRKCPKYISKISHSVKSATSISRANHPWLFTWEATAARSHSTAVIAPKDLLNQRILWHISELTPEKNHTHALCAASTSPSPPRSLRTCALTLVSGPFSALRVVWLLLKGEFTYLVMKMWTYSHHQVTIRSMSAPLF